MPDAPMSAKEQAAYNRALHEINNWRPGGWYASNLGELILDLSGIGLTRLPPEIGKLTNMTWLDLSDNRLSDLPPEIGQLHVLACLDLKNNQLRTLPTELQKLSRLESLLLHGNPALNLSPAVLGGKDRFGGGRWVSPATILKFYFQRERGQARPLNEVKLVLVGRGGAGKSSLVRAIRDQPFHADEEATPGIALCDWKMAGCQGEPITAHVWDFAGQVITHSLHQFFFSVRSVYLLVLTGRENSERADAEYWLSLIRAFGTDDQGNGPPVIIALNKWDEPDCRPRVDRGALQERYPFIRAFVETDCKTSRGTDDLKSALCRAVDSLPWVREDFPAAWNSVRLTLTDDATRRAHLPFAEFRALCARHKVEDAGQQDALAEVLHNLGTALNYRNDPRLREATVLLPDWLTANVYALMRRAEASDGNLAQADVDEVLASETDPAMRAYLMRLMERFEIAYLARAAGGRWLVPQALPDSQPAGLEVFRDAKDATGLRYTYTALPEGLVARAIVRLHEFIEEADSKRLQWGSGAVLTREGARALLRAEPANQVSVTVLGPTDARRQLAGLCQSEMRAIHAEIRGLDPIEETFFQGEWVEIVALELDEKNGSQTGIRVPGQGTVMFDPTVPINAYSQEASRVEEIWKPRAFISYSKENIVQRKRLDLELKVLMSEGLLESGWNDRMIVPGDKWDG